MVKEEGSALVEVVQEVKVLEVMDNLVGSHDPRKIWMRTKEKDQTLVQDYPELVKTAEETKEQQKADASNTPKVAKNLSKSKTDDSKVGKKKDSVYTEEKVGGGTTPLPGAQDSWLRECQDAKGDTATKLPDLVDAPVEETAAKGIVTLDKAAPTNDEMLSEIHLLLENATLIDDELEKIELLLERIQEEAVIVSVPEESNVKIVPVEEVVKEEAVQGTSVAVHQDVKRVQGPQVGDNFGVKLEVAKVPSNFETVETVLSGIEVHLENLRKLLKPVQVEVNNLEDVPYKYIPEEVHLGEVYCPAKCTSSHGAARGRLQFRSPAVTVFPVMRAEAGL